MILRLFLLNFLLFLGGLLGTVIFGLNGQKILCFLLLDICSKNLTLYFYFLSKEISLKKLLLVRIVLFLLTIPITLLEIKEPLIIYMISLIFLFYVVLFKIPKEEKIKKFLLILLYQIFSAYIVYYCFFEIILEVVKVN